MYQEWQCNVYKCPTHVISPCTIQALQPPRCRSAHKPSRSPPQLQRQCTHALKTWLFNDQYLWSYAIRVIHRVSPPTGLCVHSLLNALCAISRSLGILQSDVTPKHVKTLHHIHSRLCHLSLAYIQGCHRLYSGFSIQAYCHLADLLALLSISKTVFSVHKVYARLRAQCFFRKDMWH